MASDFSAPPPYSVATCDGRDNNLAQPMYHTSYPSASSAPYPREPGPASTPYYEPNLAQPCQSRYATASTGQETAAYAPAAGSGYVMVAPVTVAPRTYKYTGPIILAIFVFCCCPIASIIASVLGEAGRDRAQTDREASRRYNRASVAVSVSGIAIAVIVVTVVSVLCSNGLCNLHRPRF